MTDKKGALRIWYAIRAVTVVPVMCAGMLAALWVHRPEIFTGPGHLLCLALSLVLLPLLVYPILALIPPRADGGSRSRSILPMAFAVSGYALACLVNLLFGAGRDAWLICLEYLAGGAILFLFNKLLHVNVSGHTAGVAGPALLLLANGMPWALPVGILVLAAVGVACLKTEMHTLWQLLAGVGVALAAFLMLCAPL